MIRKLVSDPHAGTPQTHRRVRTKGSLSPTTAKLDLQAALRGVKDLAASQKHKTVAKTASLCAAPPRTPSGDGLITYHPVDQGPRDAYPDY
jgi:hypothetical protein